MQKRDTRSIDTTSQIEIVKNLESPTPSATLSSKILPRVKLRLRVDANYKITGRVSRQEYLFAGAGSTGDVDERDVEWLLSLRQGKGCCGGGGGNTVFELAGE
jgi:hypothetical protein